MNTILYIRSKDTELISGARQDAWEDEKEIGEVKGHGELVIKRKCKRVAILVRK
jgi:hypothetical protein